MTVCLSQCYIAVIDCLIWSGGVDRIMVQHSIQSFVFRGFLMLFLFALLIPKLTRAQQPAVNLMPLPTSVQPGTGSLRIDSAFSVALTGRTERRLERGVERFLQQLARQTALPISLKPSKSAQATLV